jgi:hypothetical protein
MHFAPSSLHNLLPEGGDFVGDQARWGDPAVQATLRRNLRWYRQQQGMKQSTLATAAGYAHHSSISKYETGDRRIPLERVPDLARGLGVPVMLLYWEGDPPPPPAWVLPNFP